MKNLLLVLSLIVGLINIAISEEPVGTKKVYGGQYDVVTTVGNTAYVGTSADLKIFNVSTPGNPQLVKIYPTNGAVNGIYFSSNRLYLATSNGLEILDVSTPLNPIYLGIYVVSTVNNVEVVGNLAYIAMDSGLQIVNIDDPSVPVLLGAYSESGGTAKDVSVVGNYAYVASYIQGLKIIDI